VEEERGRGAIRLGEAGDEERAPAAQALGEEETGFELWAWYSSHDLPSLDPRGGEPIRGLYERLRGRINLGFAEGAGQVFVEADVLTGQLWGDEAAAQPARSNTGTLPRNEVGEVGDLLGLVDPRAAYVGYTTPVGLVRLGMQRNAWGLGLLANGGVSDPSQLFNQPYGGDRVLRALYATTPLAAVEGFEAGDKLFLALGADVVWRDENASLLGGDWAYQGILSGFYKDDATQVGFFGVLRDQTDEGGATLDVVALDAAFEHNFGGDVWVGSISGEVAWIGGRTTRALPQTEGAQETKLSGIGAAGELMLLHRTSGVGGRLLAGFASGDANPDDDTQYRFRFDPNYRVGLILFDTYLPSITRANYRGVTNLDRQGQAPRGVEALISEGGVENAYYVQPQLTFGSPDGLLTGIALLYAVADQPVVDLYKTFASGGLGVGPFGRAEAASELGAEVDVAVQYQMELGQELALQIKAEYGIFFPGEAFEDAAGNGAPPQNLLRARVALTW
jgi:hypothetical protein